METNKPLKRTIEIEIYKFDGLCTDAKEIAIEYFRDINTDYEWWEGVDYLALQGAEEIFDLSHPPFTFSGFYGQGNGCKIIISEIKDSAIPEKLKELWKNGTFRIWSNNGRNSGYTIEFDYEINDNVSIDEENMIIDLKKELEDKLKTFSKKLYIELKTDYEYRISDESIEDTIRANEMEFYANGKIFREERL